MLVFELCVLQQRFYEKPPLRVVLGHNPELISLPMVDLDVLELILT